MKSLLIAATICFSQMVSASGDPYRAVEHIKFDNGLSVFLALYPESTLTEIELSVATGMHAETPRNYGVAHLLEHVLFRDKGLADEMTYLQVIKENGGSANGGTNARETTYFGTIPPAKSVWMLQNFAKMLLNPSISDEYVNKEKGTVELERGRPGPITQLIGMDPWDILYPRYLQPRDFWSSEFGVEYKNYGRSEEQLSTQRLTTEQVREFYRDYYYPANMQLFVAGKFDRDLILKEIEKTWASQPPRSGKVLPMDPIPRPVARPFMRLSTDDQPYVYIGTKFWGATVQETQILDSYSEYLAHRLMKEIRNKKGQTYTAYGVTSEFKGYGATYVQFQTPAENLDENLGLVKEMIAKETGGSGLSAQQVFEATSMYLDSYLLRGQESNRAIWIAKDYARVLREHGEFTSPYDSLFSAGPIVYNETLQKYFTPDRAYQFVYRPPLLFRGDRHLALALTVLLTFAFLRFFLTKEFRNDRVRWVRKVQYPALGVVEGAVLLLGWYASRHFWYPMEAALDSFAILNQHVLLAEYAPKAFWSAISIAFTFGLFALIPKKLMIVDDTLVIKSLSYYSRRIPLSEISSVRLVKPWLYPFPIGLWFGKVRMRMFYMTLPWRRGLLVELKDGRGYVFSVRSPEACLAELQGFLASEDAPIKLLPAA